MPVEVFDPHTATVGRATVRRALPRRGLRTIGAWCFADQMGPEFVTETSGLDVGPHPHTGLQTATWLLEGAVLHKDSLGSEQLIRPGQLNLMTAGRGIVHAEEAVNTYRGNLHGVQLWIAQPDSTRNGDSAFAHHGELPAFEADGLRATVFVGELGGVASAAQTALPLVGAEIALARGAHTLQLRPDFEYGVIALDETVAVDGHRLDWGQLASLGAGNERVTLQADGAARIMLLGGVPFGERLTMWWNFIGRSTDEVAGFTRDWMSHGERFGDVASTLARTDAPRPPWEPVHS